MLIIITIILSMTVVGCQPKQEPAETIVIEEEVIEEPEPVEEVAKEEYICLLTGLGVENEEDIKHRPVAVMIDNERNARPQSGITEADIVFEMPVEGNITRYMAIYHHLPSEKIGPVRSARPYFIDKA
ncbi:MAG: DUF3048 domain-containing protein, partial [Clostridiales bacterium]|nr:DUF3048 domain-containing protein [Clostridiales bacterium]